MRISIRPSRNIQWCWRARPDTRAHVNDIDIDIDSVCVEYLFLISCLIVFAISGHCDNPIPAPEGGGAFFCACNDLGNVRGKAKRTTSLFLLPSQRGDCFRTV